VKLNPTQRAAFRVVAASIESSTRSRGGWDDDPTVQALIRRGVVRCERGLRADVLTLTETGRAVIADLPPEKVKTETFRPGFIDARQLLRRK